ncbi:receptor-transporting protein 4 [Pleuronectes platessa]|uniref:receptor-transporting protein 4 n=1 Tax=Pleuronectes platessa TaxID=8262 RepID=UPI00232A1927|nr:receptor-transporting protein 4 [Pleuronectes platessa]
MDLKMWMSTFKKAAKDLQPGDTWNLEFDSNIEPSCPEPGWKQYITQTSAWFKCSLCPRGWPSNVVKVLFQMHLEGSTGTVKVRVFSQKCQNCSNAPMEDPIVEPENITILMMNLVTKIRIKCYNEDLDDVKRDQRKLEVKSSHDPANCEGCRLGVCGD